MAVTLPPNRRSDEENTQFLRNRGAGKMKEDFVVPDLPPGSVMSNRHPYQILKRTLYITISVYILNSMDVWHQVLHGSQVNHTWLQIALAISVAILGIKIYLEMYQGRYKKKRVDYKNFRTATHIVMILLLFATIAFHAALWPAYGGGRTLCIMLLYGFGILLPLMLILPTWIQNPLFIILFTFFIQQYQ